jgi:hypothetical protein
LEREPSPANDAPPPSPNPNTPLEQRDPDVKRAIQELKMPQGTNPVTAGLRP